MNLRETYVSPIGGDNRFIPAGIASIMLAFASCRSLSTSKSAKNAALSERVDSSSRDYRQESTRRQSLSKSRLLSMIRISHDSLENTQRARLRP